eukprot:CAMPEP_0167759992 /NCGR_PEP_ID=MMETSP0110_2-20121227/11335_1 /TAXON_ID=629695 /ORGANISM="Gymnochlora sp., Strain CCMP2014" /LENGTH=183 /DNA_ID=CAMNT_0007646447 /DNA_START=65 /DNA_END=616 /DNA_ORIENTATION=-
MRKRKMPRDTSLSNGYVTPSSTSEDLKDKPPPWKRVKVQTARLLKVGMWAYNSETLEMWLSQEVHRIFKIKTEANETKFSCFKRLIHQDDRDLFLYLFERAANKGIPYQMTHRLYQEKGEKWCRTRCRIAKQMSTEDPIRLCGTIQDITCFKSLTHSKHDQKGYPMSCGGKEESNMKSECPIV